MLPATVSTPTDPDNPDEDLSAEEMAGRLAEALEQVEQKSGGGYQDPIGWVMIVSLNLEGYKGVPLLLTWSLNGIDVPTTWSADSVAYKVLATTARDAGSAEVWVPDLQRPGTYKVNVKLIRESDRLVIAQAVSLEVPNP